MNDRLRADGVELGYDGRVVVDGLDFAVPDAQITAIVGPNACGKSTLLRALARILKPGSGRVLLDGHDIHSLPTKEVARRLGLLPQAPNAPVGITVHDLVARGRSPHQSFFQQWSAADEHAVASALRATETEDLAERRVDELSGGQRQRVWIAMALAQDTELLLLDEPTTFLDLAHQIEVLDLIRTMNLDRGRTIVVVLHDLNLAARYAQHLVVMSEGAITTSGAPPEVLSAETVTRVFGVDCIVIDDPVTGAPLVIPSGVSTNPSIGTGEGVSVRSASR